MLENMTLDEKLDIYYKEHDESNICPICKYQDICSGGPTSGAGGEPSFPPCEAGIDTVVDEDVLDDVLRDMMRENGYGEDVEEDVHGDID